MSTIKKSAILILIGLAVGLYLWGSSQSKQRLEYQEKFESTLEQLVDTERQLKEKTKLSKSQVRVITRTITRPDGTVEKSKEKIENKTKEFRERTDKEVVSSETRNRTTVESRVSTHTLTRYHLELNYRVMALDDSPYKNLGLSAAARIGNLPLFGVVAYDFRQLDGGFSWDLRHGFRLGLRAEF